MASLIDTNNSSRDFKSSHFRKNIIQMGSSPVYSRVYKDVNKQKGIDYSDYKSLKVNWGEENNYEVTKKIGRGRYSEVFVTMIWYNIGARSVVMTSVIFCNVLYVKLYVWYEQFSLKTTIKKEKTDKIRKKRKIREI